MTFLQKYEELKKSIPVPALSLGQLTENCHYCDYVYQGKNSQYCFASYKLENSTYCVDSWGRDLVDCFYAIECELCYACVDSNKCYNSVFLYDCNSCRDCYYSALCVSCNNCFGCVGLTHKQYCIFNKQYSKEEYFKKIESLKKQSQEKLLKQMQELKKIIPHPASTQLNNQNCLYGDYIYNSKNSYWCFNGYYLEDSGFCYTSGLAKQSWDLLFSGTGDTQLSYEIIDGSGTYNCAYLFTCSDCINCFYSSYLLNCSDCFGCVGLSNKKYCILNNQLTKDQYEKAVTEVKKELGWRL